MSVDSLWLPKGGHWDLNIEHSPGRDAGPFASGARPKFILHTTESPRERVDEMLRVVRNKGAEPHFVLGWRRGLRYPVVIQCVALNRAARTLVHPSGTPETNRAGCIQVEICGFAADTSGWDDNYLKAVANLITLTHHRVKFDLDTRPFPGTRIPAGNFHQASGIFGHCHVHGNDHTDPGHFPIGKVLRWVKEGHQELKPR